MALVWDFLLDIWLIYVILLFLDKISQISLDERKV